MTIKDYVNNGGTYGNQLPSSSRSLHHQLTSQQHKKEKKLKSGKKSHNKFSRIDVAVGNKKHKFYYFIYNKCSNLWCIFMDFQFGSNESNRMERSSAHSVAYIIIACLLAACLTPLGTNQNKPDILFWIIYCRIVSICYDDGRTDADGPWFHDGSLYSIRNACIAPVRRYCSGMVMHLLCAIFSPSTNQPPYTTYQWFMDVIIIFHL